MGEGQSEISDWWSFGIIIYEMFFGITPFLDTNDDNIYNEILNDEIKFPKTNIISAEAKDLIQKLLIKEKNERLGFEGGFEFIKKHHFFNGIDFDKLEKMEIEAPYKPTINDALNNNENEQFLFFDNEYIQETIGENRHEFFKKNQYKFGEFYE